MAEIQYVGSELDLFAQATRWKGYWSSIVRPYLGRRILDVGAGLGATIYALGDAPHDLWTALEPDPLLALRLRERMGASSQLDVRIGTTADLGVDETFDSILYVDVLEHIEDDCAEMTRAASHLTVGGHLIVLSPAHQWLFSPFDAAIGHVRRYSRASLQAAVPSRLRCERLIYMDSVGMLASIGNRILLRAAQPSSSQIALWDGVMVPLSRLLDPLLLMRVGKSVLGIWRNDVEQP